MSSNNRYLVNFPEDDPRFDELRTYLNGIKRRGKHSPVPRILSEWVLLGYLFTTGKLNGGNSFHIALSENAPAPKAMLAEMLAIAEGADQFSFD